MRKKLIVFGLLCVISTALFSQNEWVSQYNTAQQSYVDGDLVSATTSAKNSLKNYLQQSGEINANYQSILRLLSTISFESGSYQEGIEYGDKELSILDQLGASKDLTYAGVLYNLGSTHQQLGNNEQAQNYLNLTLDIYRGYYANTDEELINCQWKLASIKFAENHIEEAFQLFSEAFANYGDREEVTPDYLYACYDYGNLLMEKDDHAQCVQYLGIVKRIYEDSGYNDTEEYQNVIERMANAYQKVDRLKAEEMYVLALNKYSTSIENSSDVYIGLMNNRAVNLQAMGKTEEAQAILKTVGGQGGNDVSSLNNLAALSQQEGDYQEAEKLYVQALEMISDQVSKEYAEVMENLAMVYVNTGRTQLATESIGKSSTIIRSVYGDTNLRYASSLRKQALIAKSNRDFALAEQSYENALAITSQSNDESLLHLQTLNGMAVLFKELGKYNQADSLFEVARLGADNLASQHSGFYALLLNNQAALKEIKGENLAAKELFMKSLGLMESADNTGKTYLATLENLSTIHIELGEYDQAEAVLEKSQQLIAEKYGETSSIYAANVLNYGRLEQAMGRYPKAEPHFKTALELMKSNHGDQHPEYARALNAMALYFQILGNMNEAEPLLEQSKNIYEVTYGKSHPEYITSIENLSSLYQMQGEKEKALPLLQEALAMDSEVYGIDHPIYATTLHNLASLYQSMGDQVKAEPLFVQALTIDERIYGKQHRSYAKTLYNLGTLYQDLGKYDEAETTLLEVLAIRKEILGEEHPDYAYSLYGIASLYHATQNLNKAFPFYEQVINKYIKQIDEYFPSMSEKEKSAYYAKIKPVFDAFFDFCVDYQLYDQSVSQVSPIARMYDLQLSTKALLLNATNKVRDRILESGDEQLIADYREWTSTKERLVKYFNYTQKELVDQSIDVNLL
jgi:tetratricopeptide (TPR) repeat protein